MLFVGTGNLTKTKGEKNMKKQSYSAFVVFLIVTLIFTGLPRYANAAVGSMTVTSANGVQVVGQSANLSVTYNLGEVLSLLGSITYTLSLIHI